MIYTTIYRCLRASTLMVLNRNIAIFITTKYQNVPYNGRAKAIFFGSAATVKVVKIGILGKIVGGRWDRGS